MAWAASAEVDRIGFGSHVDGASKLLIDSALFLELREGGVSCSCGKVFVWSCVTQCKDPETPALICCSRSPSRLHIIKIIPQPSSESLFVTWLAWLSSVKSSPITVSGTMVYSKDHSPWLVWREWFVNHYSAACRVRNTWGMQITCHQIDSCAAKSEKLQLLLSQIGFFPHSERPPSPMFSDFWKALTKCVYFSVLYWWDIGNYLIAVAVRHQLCIHGANRKVNIRLRFLIDVHLNRQTNWPVMHFKFTLQCYSGFLGKKHSIKAKLCSSLARYPVIYCILIIIG